MKSESLQIFGLIILVFGATFLFSDNLLIALVIGSTGFLTFILGVVKEEIENIKEIGEQYE